MESISSKTRILRFAAFRPFYITSIYGLGKAANPPDISVVGVCEFYKISNSPTPFLRTQNNVANFPLPRGREANSSPCIPRHIPLVGPGSYPRGKPMTRAWRPSFSISKILDRGFKQWKSFEIRSQNKNVPIFICLSSDGIVSFQKFPFPMNKTSFRFWLKFHEPRTWTKKVNMQTRSRFGWNKLSNVFWRSKNIA